MMPLGAIHPGVKPVATHIAREGRPPRRPHFHLAIVYPLMPLTSAGCFLATDRSCHSTHPPKEKPQRELGFLKVC